MDISDGQRPRESTCSTPDCDRKILYMTGSNYGRWVHADDGKWQCEGYGQDQNRQAGPPIDYYRSQK